MGSMSDYEALKPCCAVLEEFGVAYEVKVVSAHRTPHKMLSYAEEAQMRGLKVIIAAAGGAAHLPGMIASVTHLPVIGLPIRAKKSLDGWDSILSILQMPEGVPVATVALNAAANAALLAIQILATYDAKLEQKLLKHKEGLKAKVARQNDSLAHIKSASRNNGQPLKGKSMADEAETKSKG